MKRRIAPYVIVVVNALASAVPALAVPVVPNFQQGSMTSHTETESTVTETINSVDYRTGWEYSVTGVGVDNNGAAINPQTSTSTVTVSSGVGGEEGAVTGTVTSSFDALDMSAQTTSHFTNLEQPSNLRRVIKVQG